MSDLECFLFFIFIANSEKKFFLLFTMFTVCLFNNQCFKCYSESFFLIIIKVVSVIQYGFYYKKKLNAESDTTLKKTNILNHTYNIENKIKITQHWKKKFSESHSKKL
jgi:general stress protein CsbA